MEETWVDVFRPISVLTLMAALAACEGVPVKPGDNAMDWGVGAYSMSPDERAQMADCTRHASWEYCRRQMLGPGF